MNYGLLQEIKKKNKIRIWIALCTQTKQIVAYHIGKGFQADCENFYSKIPEEYLDLKSYSDCNSCYQSVFSSMTHRCTNKKKEKQII